MMHTSLELNGEVVRQAGNMSIEVLQMQEGQLTVKELINAVLQKSRQALPELTLLSRQFQKLTSVQRPKSRHSKKKGCLNSTFLTRLSECGESIRRVLTDALSRQFPGREVLRRHFNEYMQVIYEIRRQHETAHREYDMHNHSTAHKQRFLEELKLQTQRRESLQAELQFLLSYHQKQMSGKDRLIGELQRKIAEKQRQGSFAEVQKIWKRGTVERRLSSQKLKSVRAGTDDHGSVETDKLRERILQLQAQIQEKDELYMQEIYNQNTEILQLQSKFQQLMRQKSFQNATPKCRHSKCAEFEGSNKQKQFLRLLLIQSASIQQYIAG